MNVKARYTWALMILFVVGMVSTADATVFRSGEQIKIPAGTTISDEVYAFGQSIDVGGKVTSDLTAAANDVRVSESASVGGSANVAGSTVNIAGKVADNLRAAGSTLTVSSTVGLNAALAGSEVMLAGAGKVGRDLFIAGNTVDMEGSVGRNLHIAATQATVNGPVGGDVSVDASQVVIGPDAVIRGNLTYTSSASAKIDPGARILGKTIHKQPQARQEGLGPLKWFLWLVGLVALIIVGLILLGVAPVAMSDASRVIFSNPWLALLAGFVFLIVVPAIVFVLFFTLVGIPLALIILAIYLILLYISRVVVGLMIGMWIFSRGGRPSPSRFGMFFAGILIFWLLTAIPFVGPVISFVGMLLGLGGLILSRYAFFRQMRTENRL